MGGGGGGGGVCSYALMLQTRSASSLLDSENKNTTA